MIILQNRDILFIIDSIILIEPLFFLSTVDCQWGGWNDWTNCSSGCIGGNRIRTRYVNITMEHDGRDCKLEKCKTLSPDEDCESQTEKCNKDKECPGIPFPLLLLIGFYL